MLSESSIPLSPQERPHLCGETAKVFVGLHDPQKPGHVLKTEARVGVVPVCACDLKGGDETKATHHEFSAVALPVSIYR